MLSLRSGFSSLDCDEFREALLQIGQRLNDFQLGEVMAEIDLDGGGSTLSTCTERGWVGGCGRGLHAVFIESAELENAVDDDVTSLLVAMTSDHFK